MPNSVPPLDGPAFGTSRALMRLVDGALDDILGWHGGGDCSKVVDGTLELTNKDLLSLGLDDGYFDAILESHEQLMSSLRWND